MEEENSKKMDVSYGVDKPEESAEIKAETKASKKAAKKNKKSQKETSKAVEKKEEKPVKKKSLIEEINEMKASGDVNSSEFKEKMAKLENILGVDQINPFGTNEADIFEDRLKGMSYADMRQLAHGVGVSPFQTENQLKSVLKKEFQAQNKNNMRNIMPESSSVIKLDPNNPQHKKTLDILGEI